MADDRRFEGFSLLAGFVVGSLTIGLIAYFITKTFMLLRGGGGGQLQGGGSNPINIYNVSGGQLGLPEAAETMSARALTNEMGLPDTSFASRMETVTLNPVRTVRVFSAPRKGPMWRVHLRVIGPAGGYGLFSIDNALPTGPSSNLTIGSPQAIVVPANGWSEIRLGPRQILYGRAAGTEDDVQVSITASAEIV